LIPNSLMIGHHFSASDFTSAPSASGVCRASLWACTETAPSCWDFLPIVCEASVLSRAPECGTLPVGSRMPSHSNAGTQTNRWRHIALRRGEPQFRGRHLHSGNPCGTAVSVLCKTFRFYAARAVPVDNSEPRKCTNADTILTLNTPPPHLTHSPRPSS
jgi:hypothetical protein